MSVTATFYPDAHTESTSVDGYVQRGIVDETLSTIRAGAGQTVLDTSASMTTEITTSSTTNQFRQLTRGIYVFDTSSIPASAVIESATLSLYGTDKANQLGGSPEIDIVASTPASNTALAASDYGNLGTTVFASMTYASWSTAGYNDFSLDSNGIANISKGGISKFGSRVNWDTDNSFGGSWAALSQVRFNHSLADNTGTSQDPKLVVVYKTFVPRVIFI